MRCAPPAGSLPVVRRERVQGEGGDPHARGRLLTPPDRREPDVCPPTWEAPGPRPNGRCHPIDDGTWEVRRGAWLGCESVPAGATVWQMMRKYLKNIKRPNPQKGGTQPVDHGGSGLLDALDSTPHVVDVPGSAPPSGGRDWYSVPEEPPRRTGAVRIPPPPVVGHAHSRFPFRRLQELLFFFQFRRSSARRWTAQGA